MDNYFKIQDSTGFVIEISTDPIVPGGGETVIQGDYPIVVAFPNAYKWNGSDWDIISGNPNPDPDPQQYFFDVDSAGKIISSSLETFTPTETLVQSENEAPHFAPHAYTWNGSDWDIVNPDTYLFQLTGTKSLGEAEFQTYRKPDVFGVYPDFTNAIDVKGDVIDLPIYASYDESTDVFSDLAIRESRTYYRDTATGIPYKRSITIEWYAKDEVTVLKSKTLVRQYSGTNGLKQNETARGNLLDKAKGYLYQTLVATYGLVTANGYKDLTLEKHSVAMSEYIQGTIDHLLTEVANDTDAWMTPTIKATIDSILNVNYSA